MKKRIYILTFLVAAGILTKFSLDGTLFTGFLQTQQLKDSFIEEHVNQLAFDQEFALCPQGEATNSPSDIKKQKAVIEALLANNTSENDRNMFFDIVNYYNTQTVEVLVEEVQRDVEGNVVMTEGDNPVPVIDEVTVEQRLLNKDIELDTIEQGAGFIVYEDIQKLGLIVNKALAVSCGALQVDFNFDVNKENVLFTLNFRDLEPITSQSNLFVHNQESLAAQAQPAEGEGGAEANPAAQDGIETKRSILGQQLNLFQPSLSTLLLQTNQKRYKYQAVLIETDSANITTPNINRLENKLTENFRSAQAGTDILNDDLFLGVHKTPQRSVSGFQKHEIDLSTLENISLDYNKDYILALKLESNMPASQTNFPADADANKEAREKLVMIHIQDQLQELSKAYSDQEPEIQIIKASSDGTLLITVEIADGLRENLPESIEDNLELIALELDNGEEDDKILIFAKAVTQQSIIFEANDGTANLKNGAYTAKLLVYENQEIQLPHTFVLEDIDNQASSETGSDIIIDRNIITLLSPNEVSINITGRNLSDNPKRYALISGQFKKDVARSVTLNEDKTEAVLEFGNLDACYTRDCSALRLGLFSTEGELENKTNLVIEIEPRELIITGTQSNTITAKVACLNKYDQYTLTIKSDDSTQEKEIFEVCKDTDAGPFVEFEFTNTLSPGVYVFGVKTNQNEFNQHTTSRKVIKENKNITKEILKEKSFICTNGNKSLPGTKTECKTLIGSDEIIEDEMLIFIEGTEISSARRLIKTTTNQGTFLGAKGIVVPDDKGGQPNILLADRNNTEDVLQTSSFIDIIDVADRDLDGFSETDKLHVEITEDFAIGDNINMNIEIPNSLEFGFLQVAYYGDRETQNNKGALYTYCSKEFVDNVNKQFIKKACNKFTQNQNIAGPDVIMVEDYNTNKIKVPGFYDIRITGLTLNPDNTITKFVERQKEAFRATAKIYLINSSMGINYPHNQTQSQPGLLGRIFGAQEQSQVAPNPKCMSLYSDINITNPLCNDLVYLNEMGVYKGQFEGNSVVANTHKQALRAHLYTLVERLYSKTENLRPVQPDVRAFINQVNDIDEDTVRNQNNRWWVLPTITLKHYEIIRTDSNGNLEPFKPVTQYEAAEIIGNASNMLPNTLGENRVQEVIDYYSSIDIKINPEAPATIGDLVALVARAIKVKKNPYLYQQAPKEDLNRIYGPQQTYQPNPYQQTYQQQQFNPSYQNQYYNQSISPYRNYYPSYGYM